MSSLDRFDYAEAIISELQGSTDINFQTKVGEVLKRYYKSCEKTYEMPNSSGGDDKNDGWVVEDKRFYQIFSPQQVKKAFRKEIQEKFSEDYAKLLELIYQDGKWSGELKEFIFIVNTIDRNLPHDSIRYFEEENERFERDYKQEFLFEVTNLDYIRDKLLEMNLEDLQTLSAILKVKSHIDYNAYTVKTIYQVIDSISGKLQDKIIYNEEGNYERVSSPKKIEINDLESVEDEISRLLINLDVIEDVVETLNQDVLYSDKFQRVVDYIIRKYEDMCEDYSGSELYEKLVADIIEFADYQSGLKNPCKMIVVYIFDKCDIFEKEEVES